MRSALLPSLVGAALVSACGAPKDPCDTGYYLASDGECYPEAPGTDGTTDGGTTDGGTTDGGTTDGGTTGGTTDGGTTDGGTTDGGTTDGGTTDGGTTDGGETTDGGTDGGITSPAECGEERDDAGTGAMVCLSGGSFSMGCTEEQNNCNEDEEPVREVTLTHYFWIGQFEVTQASYEAVMGENPSGNAGCDDCPAENLSWYDAAAFANAVSEAAGLESCYTCADGICEPAGDPYTCEGYRLPTEAEWEYAARCGEELRYAGSDNVDDVAWTNNNADTTQPVGTLYPNSCTLYDMSGNVWEWVHDRYGPYDEAELVDPDGPGPEDSQTQVRRGGSFEQGAGRARVSARYESEPDRADINRGLRLVRVVP